MFYWFSFILGLSLGSFANVCIVRLPEDQSIYKPRSRCPSCKQPIRAVDNIPVLSYLFLRGKCRHCQESISLQYPLIELTMGFLFLFNAWLFQADFMTLFIVELLTFYLLTLSVIDYHHRIIPDELSLSLLTAGLLLAWWNPWLQAKGIRGFIEAFAAGALGCLGMLFVAWAGEKIYKTEAMGGGDIKLVAAFGALLGWKGLLGSLLFGSLLGGVFGLYLILRGKKGRRETLPFGPFLSLGAYLACVLPSDWLMVIFP